ncbi:MAG: thiamine pyrophosphate-dependent dehydrogenase E1 component subunit alpha [Christensenellales bacterium]|jgi:pyruvate dehydrogenase E1 component alpha subunit
METMNKERMLDIYERMQSIRQFEEKAIELYESDIVRGSLHLYVGQEAIAATICSFLSKDDYITSTHRGHGHIIAKGVPLDGAMAELLGKEGGVCKGRGGSMHITDMDVGILGANGIVGGGIPIALGSALKSSYRNDKSVTVCFFGDGASNEGTFHEALNLASVWKLPVVFVCENNGYGMSVPASESTSVIDIASRATGYNMPGVVIDGNDVFAISEAADEAIKRAREGKGPSLLECKTYRWYGHWWGDPQPYRTREEVEVWKTKCPIQRMQVAMLQSEQISEDEIAKIEADVSSKVEQACAFAQNSPFPDPNTLLDNVYFKGQGG